MNKKRISFVKLAVLAFWLPALLLTTFTSCMNDELDDPSDRGGKEATVTFALQLPAGSQAGEPGTRALSETDDNTVKTIDILVFKGGAYQYTAYCSSVPGGSDNTRIKNFTVKLVKDTGVDLVVLTNSRTLMNAAYPSGVPDGTAKQTVMSKLKKEVSGKYDVDKSASVYPFIAMWGKKDGITIAEGTSLTGANAIPVVRMLAKVDIHVKATTFNLSSIRVYNYNTHGALVPNYLTATDWDAAINKAIHPNVPSDATRTLGPLVYQGSEISGGAKSCLGEIYLFESENHSDTDHQTPLEASQRTCLVIGGKYIPVGTPAGDIAAIPETFYRVDFAKKTGGVWAYLDLLRNHKYNVIISSVNGPGFPDPPKAFASEPVNIEADILPWDDGEMGDVVFDGQHYLAVEPGILDLFRDALNAEDGTNALSIKTDCPDGWKIEKIVDAADGISPVSWIQVMSGSPGTPVTSGIADVKANLWLKVTENTTLANRTAIIVVSAGRLRYNITVNQSTKNALALRIDTKSFVFNMAGFLIDASGNITSQTSGTANITWAPTTNPCTFLKTNLLNGGVACSVPVNTGAAQGAYALSLSPGSKTVDPGNPFKEYSSVINSVAADNDGNTLVESIIVRQLNFGVHASPKAMYVLDGSTYSIYVKSNTMWRVKSISDPSNMIANKTTVKQTTGGMNTNPGDLLNFIAVNDLVSQSILTASATIILESPDGLFADYTIVIKGETVIDAGGFYIRLYDQPAGYSWYVYANVPDGNEVTNIPPAGPQEDPARQHSCASLDGPEGKPWRLPTRDEGASVINNYMMNNPPLSSYNLALNIEYWASDTPNSVLKANAFFATKTNAAGNTLFNQAPSNYKPKTSTNYRARCIRKK